MRAITKVYALTLASFGLLFAASNAVGETAAPRLAVAQADFDFGTVQQGAVVSHDFEVRNDGGAPLTIKRILPSCSCTTAPLAKSTLQPGESTQIKGVFDTKGFSGIQEKTVRVFTNDPSNASIILTLKGTVKRDVEISPARIGLADVRKGEAASEVATILTDTQSGIKITDVIARNDNLELQVDDTSTKNQIGKKVRVTLKPSAPVGNFQGMIVVKSTSKQNPVLNIPVFARVTGDLKIEPSSVSFGLVEGPLERPISQVLKLINQGKTPIKIVSASAENLALSTKIRTIREGEVFEITVTVGEGFLDILKSRVKVVTDHPDPDQREFGIPVYGIVARKGA